MMMRVCNGMLWVISLSQARYQHESSFLVHVYNRISCKQISSFKDRFLYPRARILPTSGLTPRNAMRCDSATRRAQEDIRWSGYAKGEGKWVSRWLVLNRVHTGVSRHWPICLLCACTRPPLSWPFLPLSPFFSSFSRCVSSRASPPAMHFPANCI